ncbi:hypothetical protein D3C78_1774930 [compost metagenome]
MIEQISTNAANACSSTARRISSMPNQALKYSRQMMKPVTSSTSMLISNTQNSSFCPAL